MGGCLAGYAIQQRLGSEIVVRGALEVSRVMRGEVWRLVTSLFLHGSLLHLGCNMMALHVVGSNVERRIGRVGMLVTTVTAVACNLLAQIAFGNWHMMSIGISGVAFAFEGVQVVNSSESSRVGDIAKRCLRHIASRGPKFFLYSYLLHAIGVKIDHLTHLAGFVAGLVTGRIYSKNPATI